MSTLWTRVPPWWLKTFMQTLISRQAITEFERPSYKAVDELKELLQQVKATLC